MCARKLRASSQSDLSPDLRLMADKKMELREAGVSLVSPEVKATPPARPNQFERVFQPCLAELLGTMFFVFIGCVSVIENEGAVGRLQPALVHGLAVAAMVACMAEIRSGTFQRVVCFLGFFFLMDS